jgi:hypothetical protein
VRGLEAAIDLVLDAASPEHAELVAWAAAPHWKALLARLALAPSAPRPAGLRVLVRPIAGHDAYRPGEGPSVALGQVRGRRVQVARELHAERGAASSLLAQLGLGAPAGEDPSYDVQLDDDAAALPVLEALGALSDAGEVQLEVAEGAPRIAGRAGPTDVSLRIERRRDWFSVGGFVAVDGRLVEQADLLFAARKGQRFVDMGKRRFLALSEELQARLLDADGVLFPSKGGLQASVMAIGALGALAPEAGQIAADRAFDELRARLERSSVDEPLPPHGLRAELRPYRLAGCRWMMRLAGWGAGGCLADEMGLGKTLQALAVLVSRSTQGPQLVVAPTSVGPNWVAEARRFAPGLEPLLYRGTGRAKQLSSLGPDHLLITSYDLLARDAEALAHLRFATVVFDEAQAVKNAVTQRARAAASLDAALRIALTGTPIENHLGELWSLFQLVTPGLLGSWEAFAARFAGPIERDGDGRRRASLARLVRPFLLRRTKAQVARELPARIELARHVELSPAERALYEVARKQAIDAIAALVEPAAPGRGGRGGAGQSSEAGVATNRSRFEVLAQLTRLRRLACHPRLLDDGSRVPSSKLEDFLSLVAELREDGHRALVFSQFTSHLALVREALDRLGVGYLYLDGQTAAAERPRLVERFQRGEGELFLISLKAGGTGLNLTAADTVVQLDPWRNGVVLGPGLNDEKDAGTTHAQMLQVTSLKQLLQGHAVQPFGDVFGHGAAQAAKATAGANSPRNLQRNGWHSASFQRRMKARTAASRSATDANEACRNTRRCRMPNQTSTWFIHPRCAHGRLEHVVGDSQLGSGTAHLMRSVESTW